MLNWTIDKCIFFGISCENLTKGKKKTEIKTQTNKWKSHSVRVHCFEPCTKYCRPAKGISQITTTTTHTEKREEKINGTENNLFLYYIWCSFLVVHFFSFSLFLNFFFFLTFVLFVYLFDSIRAGAAIRQHFGAAHNE